MNIEITLYQAISSVDDPRFCIQKDPRDPSNFFFLINDDVFYFKVEDFERVIKILKT